MSMSEQTLQVSPIELDQMGAGPRAGRRPVRRRALR